MPGITEKSTDTLVHTVFQVQKTLDTTQTRVPLGTRQAVAMGSKLRGAVGCQFFLPRRKDADLSPISAADSVPLNFAALRMEHPHVKGKHN